MCVTWSRCCLLCCRDKRVQMVRELCALFQLLRENSRKISSHVTKVRRPEKYIVDFFDAFR